MIGFKGASSGALMQAVKMTSRPFRTPSASAVSPAFFRNVWTYAACSLSDRSL